MFPLPDFEYVLAADIDQAWRNFELDLPLNPLPDGSANPFYVDRPGNPTAELEDALVAPFWQPPKYFFSGHRGCGKSTELRRLAANPAVQNRYWPIHFTIRDEADINDLDFKDILLAVGSRMYRAYRAAGNRLPKKLLEELENWQGQITKEVKTVQSGRYGGMEVDAGLDAVFANMALKLKLEPVTRTELRQVFQRNVTELIDLINKIAAAIQSQENRLPLILIDDLDKPDLAQAKEIFSDRREVMLQPNCAIVYTVSSALFYSQEFEAIRDRAIFLPNVKLHQPGQHGDHDPQGYWTMRMFIHRRMIPSLMTDDALEKAIGYSGGVFRELARLMRSAIGRARRRNSTQIELADVEYAGAEIRNEYRRILDAADVSFLKEILHHNQLRNHQRLRPLLQLLALLEYRNGENWCDVHPTLLELLREELTP